MDKKVKTMEQLRDSQLMFDKTPPAFGYFIVGIVTVMIVGVLVWSMSAVKPYVIKAECTVTDTDASYVMSSYTGEIIKSYMSEGDVVQKGETLFKVKSTDYDLQLEQLEETRETYEIQISQYKRLIKSIKDNMNYFDDSKEEDELYYSSYEAYQAQVKQNQLDASAYKAYGYSEEQIQAELEKNQGKIAEIYYAAIQSAENSIKEAKTQRDSIDAQMSALGSGKMEYVIKATESGVLHLNMNYKAGMVVQAASAVATITPENGNVVVEGYITTADMARIKEGDLVQMEVDGLSQTVYGNIRGSVLQIDSNVTTMENQDGTTTSMFRIQISPEVDYIVNKAGKKVKLANGMTCESKIQYDEITYFDYAMEKLGLLSR